MMYRDGNEFRANDSSVMREQNDLAKSVSERSCLLQYSDIEVTNEPSQKENVDFTHKSSSSLFAQKGGAVLVVCLLFMAVSGVFLRFPYSSHDAPINSRSEYIKKDEYFDILSRSEANLFGGNFLRPKHEEEKEFVCDDVSPLSGFDLSKYAGTWYEQQHVSSFVEPSNCQCTTVEYADLSDSEDSNGLRSFKLHNSCQFYAFGMRFPRSSLDADAKCDENGSCYVSFFGQEVTSPNMHVLDTDYTSYAILYACERELKTVFLWILTRDPEISSEEFGRIYDKALSLVPSFDPETLARKTFQSKMCSYE